MIATLKIIINHKEAKMNIVLNYANIKEYAKYEDCGDYMFQKKDGRFNIRGPSVFTPVKTTEFK